MYMYADVHVHVSMEIWNKSLQRELANFWLRLPQVQEKKHTLQKHL